MPHTGHFSSRDEASTRQTL